MPADDFVNEINSSFARVYKRDNLTDTVLKGLGTFIGTNTTTIDMLPPQVVGVKDKSRAGFPLGFGIYSKYVTQGAVLIGDAAHRVHPLAGQGVNLGFGDVKVLVDVLANAVYSGSNVGDLNHLLKYEESRLQHNVPIMLGIHGIQSIFSTNVSPIVMARSLGLQITNSVPFLKVQFLQIHSF